MNDNLYFISYHACGIKTVIMRELEQLFKTYESSLVEERLICLFETIFNTKMADYKGRSKAPVCEYIKHDHQVRHFTVLVDDSTDTPKSAITLTFTKVKGAVKEYPADE
jgi:hypothetical protein